MSQNSCHTLKIPYLHFSTFAGKRGKIFTGRLIGVYVFLGCIHVTHTHTRVHINTQCKSALLPTAHRYPYIPMTTPLLIVTKCRGEEEYGTLVEQRGLNFRFTLSYREKITEKAKGILRTVCSTYLRHRC